MGCQSKGMSPSASPSIEKANATSLLSKTKRSTQQDALHMLCCIPYHGQDFRQSSPTSRYSLMDTLDCNATTPTFFPPDSRELL
jgi:hypothetical protein